MKRAKPTKSKSLVVGAALLLIVAVLVIMAIFDASDHARGHPLTNMSQGASSSSSSSPTGPADPSAASRDDYDGGPIARTIANRRVRDELRRRILAGWEQGEGESAAAARERRMVPPPMPTGADGRINPQYIKQVAREDLMPMLKKCYEELSVRKPGAHGRISMTFKIVGDAKLGAVVDETNLAEDAGALAEDDLFTTCARESTMTLAFRPLPFDRSAVVPITIVFEEGRDQ